MSAVLVPQLSLSMEDAKVSRWLVGNGEAVVAGQLVVELETDKATVEVEAPDAGVLRIVAPEGAVVAVDGVLAELEPAFTTHDERAEQERNEGDGPRRAGTVASPAARRIAREGGVDLAGLRGSGPGGRIVVTVGSGEQASRVLAFEPGANGASAESAELPLATAENATDCQEVVPQPPIVAHDGTIFIFSELDRAIFALDASLAVRPGWPFTPDGSLEGIGPGQAVDDGGEAGRVVDVLLGREGRGEIRGGGRRLAEGERAVGGVRGVELGDRPGVLRGPRALPRPGPAAGGGERIHGERS